jgi:hypothetical protein
MARMLTACRQTDIQHGGLETVNVWLFHQLKDDSCPNKGFTPFKNRKH